MRQYLAESIEILRQYRGHLAIVTQTIPAIDEIYGENTRRAIQGNAGIKLYLTPSDEKTVEELSKAVGKTTKTVVTRSRAIGKNPFGGRSQSERTEEVSLLPEDEARRLPLDEIVVVVDAQMPVKAKRVVYFEDPFFRKIHAAQEGELPFPEGPVGMTRSAVAWAMIVCGGIDTLTGGVGADVFVFRPNHGADRITDFRLGVDTLHLDVLEVPLQLSGTGQGVRVDRGTGSVVLEGVNISSFTVNDVVFL